MRTIKIDFSSGTPKIECDSSAAGIQGEHRASELVIIPPPDMPSELSYRLAFDPGGQSDTLSLTDGELHYELPQSITQHDAVSMTVEGYEGEDRIYKSVMVELYFDAAVDTDNPVDVDGHSIGAEVAANTAARHSHDNQETLDKFGEDEDGQPTYSGQLIGGGGSEAFVIPMTAEASDSEDIPITCDVTYSQVDQAYKAGKKLLVKITSSDFGELFLPLIEIAEGTYIFSVFVDGTTFVAFCNEGWALNQFFEHTHYNKSVLDMLSDADGKLQYAGSDVGLKGDKGDTGAAGADGYTPAKGIDYWTETDKAEIVDELKPSQVTSGTSITLADNTEYRLTDVTELTITYPDGNFECWMRLAFAANGAITVTLPATTQYIGSTPTFANGEIWELSIKDGIVTAGKVA